MKINKRWLQFLLLVGISALSMLDLGGAATAVLFLLAALILLTAARRKEFLLAPVMFVVVAYVLGYPLEMLFNNIFSGSRHYTQAALEFGMPWALRGFCAFALGYLLIAPLGPNPRKLAGRDEVWARARTSYTIYILTGIGWLAILSWALSAMLFGISLTFVEADAASVTSAASAAGTLEQILSLMANLKYPFMFCCLVLYYWKITDRHLVLLFVVLAGMSVIEIVTIGSKASIIRGIVIVSLLGTILPIRLSFRQAIMGIAALLVFYAAFGVITEYRAIVQKENQAGRSVFDITFQMEAFAAAFMSTLPFSETAGTRETEVTGEDVLRRLSHAGTFSNLLEFTGRQSPYEHAWESFLVPVYSVVPRAVLPDKPEFFHSGRNAREYYGWQFGGISVTLLGSLYYAWGYVGIIIGMGILGGLLAYIENQARRWNIYSPHWLILLVVIVLMLLDVGVIFQAIISNLIRIGLLLWGLHLFYPLFRGVMRLRTSRILGAAQGARHS